MSTYRSNLLFRFAHSIRSRLNILDPDLLLMDVNAWNQQFFLLTSQLQLYDSGTAKIKSRRGCMRLIPHSGGRMKTVNAFSRIP